MSFTSAAHRPEVSTVNVKWRSGMCNKAERQLFQGLLKKSCVTLPNQTWCLAAFPYIGEQKVLISISTPPGPL